MVPQMQLLQQQPIRQMWVLVHRHTPQAEEFQKIVEANLAEVCQDYLQSAQQNADAAVSKLAESSTDTSQLKSPRPVKVATLHPPLVVL